MAERNARKVTKKAAKAAKPYPEIKKIVTSPAQEVMPSSKEEVVKTADQLTAILSDIQTWWPNQELKDWIAERAPIWRKLINEEKWSMKFHTGDLPVIDFTQVFTATTGSSVLDLLNVVSGFQYELRPNPEIQAILDSGLKNIQEKTAPSAKLHKVVHVLISKSGKAFWGSAVFHKTVKPHSDLLIGPVAAYCASAKNFVANNSHSIRVDCFDPRDESGVGRVGYL